MKLLIKERRQIHSLYHIKDHSYMNNTQGKYRLSKCLLKVLVLVFVMHIFVACKAGGEEMPVEKVLEGQVEEDLFFPVMSLKGEELDYQYTYASKTKLSNRNSSFFAKDLLASEYISQLKVLPVSDYGLTFSLDFENVDKVNYTIYDENQKVDSGFLPINNGEIPFYPTAQMEQGGRYTVELELISGRDKAYYYWKVDYQQSEINDIMVDYVYHMISQELFQTDVSVAGEPRLWIDKGDDGQTLVKVQLVGVKRLDEGFTYKDYYYQVLVDPDHRDYQIMGSYSIDKQRYFYNSDTGWELGTSSVTGSVSSDYLEQVRRKTMENSKYRLIYNKHELVIYDKESENLNKVLRKDKFDSDYIYDENLDFQMEVLDFTNDGDIYFAVFGWQPYELRQAPAFDGLSQKIGAGIYRYANGEVSLITFMEGLDEKSFLENTYINESSLWFYQDQSLYKLDLSQGRLEFIAELLEGSDILESGISVWQGSQDKYNDILFFANIKKAGLLINHVYESGIYRRLLMKTGGKIYVGVFDLDNTYEALDQKVDYHYSTIEVYDDEGQRIDSYQSEQGSLFSGIYNLDGDLYVDILQEERYGTGENFRIDYVFDHKMFIDSADETAIDHPSDDLQDQDLISAKTKDKDIIFIKDVDLSGNPPITIAFNHKINGVYEIIGVDKDNKYTWTFEEALIQAKDDGDAQIYYIEDRAKNKQVLMYDASWYQGQAYLDKVKVMPQRPELPRGCEVTSLSVLLDYYMEDGPDKMELADGINVSTIDYKELDGIINFADMHTEFAGSMNDISQPGLGVYISPIVALAKQYIESDDKTRGAFEVTGLTFKQLLSFVSQGNPVLVITPNRYRSVPEYALEVWKTPDGYMEVTYQEHSVVVMGYDDNYVYYSDPSKGIIDKRPFDEFQAGWESIGSQAMVILNVDQ